MTFRCRGFSIFTLALVLIGALQGITVAQCCHWGLESTNVELGAGSFSNLDSRCPCADEQLPYPWHATGSGTVSGSGGSYNVTCSLTRVQYCHALGPHRPDIGWESNVTDQGYAKQTIKFHSPNPNHVAPANAKWGYAVTMNLHVIAHGDPDDAFLLTAGRTYVYAVAQADGGGAASGEKVISGTLDYTEGGGSAGSFSVGGVNIPVTIVTNTADFDQTASLVSSGTQLTEGVGAYIKAQGYVAGRAKLFAGAASATLSECSTHVVECAWGLEYGGTTSTCDYSPSYVHPLY